MGSLYLVIFIKISSCIIAEKILLSHPLSFGGGITQAYKSGDVVAAKRLFSKVIQIDPNHPDANSNMGAILMASGDLEEALPFIKTALEANFSIAHFGTIIVSISPPLR